MKGNKIIILGGAGYVGDTVVAMLVDPYQPEEVIVVDKLMFADSYLRPRVDFRCVDINTDGFWKMLDKDIDDIGAIVHLAAIVGDGACQALPELTVETNENFVKKLVKYLEGRKPDVRLIFTSTASVYGESHNIVDENSPTRPLSLYAGTKLAAENAIKESALTNWVIFRLGTLFGLSTAFGRIRADLVVNILTFKAVQGQEMSIFGGEQWRPLMHVADVGRIISRAVFMDFVGTVLLAHENYTIKQIGEIIEKEIPGAPVKYIESKFEDLRNYRVDNSLQKQLKLNASTSLEDGIRKMRDALQSGRIKNPWITRYHNAQMAKEIADGN